MIAIKIENRQKTKKINRAELAQWATKALKLCRIRAGELSVLLVGDSEIAVMNRKFLKRRGPTDVLAFAMREGRFAGISPGILGDVVISVDTAIRQAKAYRTSLRYELCLYLIHGILHLVGYDDIADKKRRKMEIRQEQIVNKIL